MHAKKATWVCFILRVGGVIYYMGSMNLIAHYLYTSNIYHLLIHPLKLQSIMGMKKNTRVVRMKVNQQSQDLKKKWSSPVIDKGFTVVPDLLLKYQNRLELSTTEFNVLIQLLSHWWKSDSLAWPSVMTLSKRIGIGRRAIQNNLSRLEQKELVIRDKPIKGLIKREYRIDNETKSQQSNIYHFEKLVEVLGLLAQEEQLDNELRNQRMPNSKKSAIFKLDTQ